MRWGLVLGLASIISVTAFAATSTWQGGNGSNSNTWNRNQNWSGNTPGGSDTAVFDNSANTSNRAPSIGSSATSVGTISFASNAFSYDISGSATLTINSGITDAATNNQTFSVNAITIGGNQNWDIQSSGGMTFSSDIALGSNTLTLTGSGSGTGTINGAITGAGALTKSGSGVWILSGSNTYSGATTISAGTLRAAAANTLSSSSAITLANVASSILDLNGFSQTVASVAGGGSTGGNISLGSATLTTGGSNSDTSYGGVISGSGAVIKGGSGKWTLSGANTYTGTTTVSAGTLEIGAGSTTGSVASTSIVNNAALSFNRSNSLTYSGVISGTGTVTQAGAGTLTLSGTNTFTGATAVNAGTLQAGAANVISSSSGLSLANTTGVVFDLNSFNQSVTSITGGGSTGGNIWLGSATLTTSDNSDTTYGGVISGTGTVIKGGTGKWTLTGDNTFTGSTTISAGTLEIGSGGTTGSLTGAVVNNAALSFKRSNSLTYSGAISGTGTLTQAGAGTLTLSGTNTFTGNTSITGGTLTLGNTLALQNSTLNYNSLGGSLSFGALTSATFGGLSGAQNLALTNGSSAAVALTVGNNNANTSYSGSLSGAGSLTKVGTGTFTLSGSNSFSGATTINNGTLQLNGANVLSNPAVTINANAASTTATLGLSSSATQTLSSLTFGGTGATTTSTNNVSLGSSSTLTLGGNVTYSATGNPLGSTISGSGTLALGSANRTFNIGDSSSTSTELTISSNISGTGQASGGLTKSGAGTLLLSGSNNTFNGLVSVSAGTLKANGTTNVGGFAELGDHSWAATPTTVITVSSGATLSVNSTFTDTGVGASSATRQYETLSLNGTGVGGVGALTATGGINTWLGNITLAGDTTISNQAASGDANALYLGPLLFSLAPTDFKLNGHALTLTGSGDIQISNSIGNSAGDTGSLTVSLSNANSLVYINGVQNYYTGATSVTKGTLFLQIDPGAHANTAVLGSLTIGDDVAGTATVQNYLNDQIADSASVTINSDGVLDLGTYGVDDTIGALTLHGGTILTYGLNPDTGLNNGGNLYFGGDIHVTASSLIDGDATTGGVNLNNTVATPRTFNVDTGTTLTMNAVVGGTGGFIKDGQGTMVLKRDSSVGYAGITEVKNGTLSIQNSGALGQNGSGTAAKGTVVDSGGTLQLDNTLGNIAVSSEALTINGTGYSSQGALKSLAGTNSWSGLVTLGSTATVNTAAGSLTLSGQVTGSATTGNTQTLTVSGSGDTTISSRIFDNRVNSSTDSHTGTLALTKTGSGTLTLGSSNSFTGAVTVSAGTLNATANDTFASPSHVNTVSVASGATLGFTTASTTNTIAALTGAGVVNISAPTAKLIVNTPTADVFDGRLTGAGTFEKQGVGTFTFSSTGNTNAFNFAGTVQLTAANSTDTLQFQGGTGSGATSTNALSIGTLKLTGGTLSLDNAYINVGTLNITGNSIIDFGTGGASVLNATNIYIASGVTLTIKNWTSEVDFLFATNPAYASSGGFRLDDQNGTLASFNAIGSAPENQIIFEGDPLSFDGSHTTWINSGYGGYTNWEIRPIPEPSTYGAMFMGASVALVGWLRYRRRAKAKAPAKTA